MATRRTSAAARTNILLEEIKAQNRATYEAVMNVKEELERKFDARFDRIEARLDVLESAVKALFAEVAALRAEVNQLRHDFDHREELGRLEALERRVEALEKRGAH